MVQAGGAWMSLFDALVRLGGLECSQPSALHTNQLLFLRGCCIPPSINSAVDILAAAQALAPYSFILNLKESASLQSNFIMEEIQQLEQQRKIRVVECQGSTATATGGNSACKAIFLNSRPDLQLNVDEDVKRLWHKFGTSKMNNDTASTLKRAAAAAAIMTTKKMSFVPSSDFVLLRSYYSKPHSSCFGQRKRRKNN